MRGLRKPWPPANVSPDGQPPQRFRDAEREYLAALPGRPNKVRFAKAEFDRLDKPKLRQVMYGEQGSLCVYCEQELSESDSRPHVEHWRPRSRNPEYALHWRNLYLSCSTKDTCGDRKGDQPLRGRRRGSRSSMAHRARLRATGRFLQRRRDIRPPRCAHGRGSPESPRTGHQRPEARLHATSGHPQSQSPNARGGPTSSA